MVRSDRSLPLVLFGLVLLVSAWTAAAQAGDQVSDQELADLKAMAEEAFVENDLDAASALYSRFANAQSEVSEKTKALMLVAYIEHMRGRSDRVLTTLTEVLTLDPAYNFRPELYPQDFAPLFYSAQDSALAGRRDQAARSVAAGARALERGDAGAARRQFEQALRAIPNYPEALYNLALVDFREGREDEAMDGFQKLVALDAGPEDDQTGATPTRRISDDLLSRALISTGLIYLRRDAPGEAATALERAVELSPEDHVAWSNLGRARQRNGDARGAVDALERAYDLHDDLAILRSLASALMEAGDVDRAIQLLRSATVRSPDDPRLWMSLGIGYRSTENLDEAVRAFASAEQADAGNAEGVAKAAALEQAAAHYRLGQMAECLEAADRVLRWDPDSVDGLVYRGLANLVRDDLQPARDAFERATELAPRRADAHLSLGTTLYHLGSWEAAERSYQRTLELDPANTAAQVALDKLREAMARGVEPQRVPRGTSASGAGSTRSGSRSGTAASTPGSRPTSPPTSPRPASGSLSAESGLRFSTVDYVALGLEGAMIDSVARGSAADRAGLRAGDLLLRIDGEAVQGGEQARARLASRAGGTVRLHLSRDGRELDLELSLR